MHARLRGPPSNLNGYRKLRHGHTRPDSSAFASGSPFAGACLIQLSQWAFSVDRRAIQSKSLIAMRHSFDFVRLTLQHSRTPDSSSSIAPPVLETFSLRVRNFDCCLPRRSILLHGTLSFPRTTELESWAQPGCEKDRLPPRC